MIDQQKQAQILADYERIKPLCADFSGILCSLLGTLVGHASIRAHSLTNRAKETEELARKLAKPDKDYSSISDVTDLAGVRVTTYFASDVDAVAAIIEQEFDVDWANSTDKRALLDPDRFGYLSLHYVVSMPERRTELREYRRFDGMKAEIQIRSILQHAWAEIEHDLGYKSKVNVPRDVRRRFARVAGLLELADHEFGAIKQQLEQYAASVPLEIEQQPGNVGIDNVSLTSYAIQSALALQLDEEVARSAGASILDVSTEFIEQTVNKLHWLGLTSIAELDEAIQLHFEDVVRFSQLWLEGFRTSQFNRAIGLAYLIYVLIAATDDEQHVEEYLEAFNVGEHGKRRDLASRIVRIYRQISKRSE